MERDEDRLFFNGVDATTGRCGIEPLGSVELLRAILQEGAPRNLADLRLRQRQDAGGAEAMAVLLRQLEETAGALRAELEVI